MTDELRQSDYYTATADHYDADHLREDAEHSRALHYVAAIANHKGFRSGLDVGAGTGRALRFLSEGAPHLDVRGIEPVQALIDVAVHRHGIHGDRIQQGTGQALPFEDGAFDFVLAQAVMHHVSSPASVIAEMLRVARHAIFIVDTNRFGHGHPAARVIKLALSKSRLWPVLYRLRTAGRGYRVSEGDGLAYSYSVYDSLPLVERWAEEIQLISVTPLSRQVSAFRWFQPLLTSHTVLMCAFRTPTRTG
jgi:SAM-dependent methyltransferase